jgi:Fe-S-cluster-containing hydrogenase component 2
MIIRVHPEKCTGCRACETYCALEQEGLVNPALARVRVLKDEPRNLFLPILCPPCDEKACVDACPEPGAMTIDPCTGAVVIAEALCTGCSKCIRACSIGAIRLLRQAGRGKFGKAVAFKCNQCGGAPWCVKVCAPGALEYVEESGQPVFESLRVALADAEKILAERGMFSVMSLQSRGDFDCRQTTNSRKGATR